MEEPNIAIFIEEHVDGSNFKTDESSIKATTPGLDIPTINWDEIHDKKNKKNKIESNIRKTQHKEIQKEKRRLVRKITPSHTDNKCYLEKLHKLRATGDSFQEEEDEEEENS